MSRRRQKVQRCNKRRYRTELDAKIALASCLRPSRGPERRPKYEKRYYSCPKCKGWHLTSQDKES